MPIIPGSIGHFFVIVVDSPERRDRPRPVSYGEFINFGAPIACCSVTIPCRRASCSVNGAATRAVRSGLAVGDPPRLDEPRTPPRPRPDSPACVEAARQDGGCPRSPRARLRLVHRGVPDDGPEGGEGADGRAVLIGEVVALRPILALYHGQCRSSRALRSTSASVHGRQGGRHMMRAIRPMPTSTKQSRRERTVEGDAKASSF